MVNTRVMRVGPRWLKFRDQFKFEIEPLLERKLHDSEITDRMARLLEDWNVIEESKKQLRRRKGGFL